MFNLFYGNDLDGLAAELGRRIVRPRRSDLLVPECVLIPQAGMQRWLEITLAERYGVVANIEFRLPGEFVRDLLRTDDARRTRPYAFDRDVLRWRLLPLLATLADEPIGAPIAHYLGAPRSQLKRVQLARELSAAFERYQAYRREMLDAWEAGAETDEWQAELWRRLVRGSGEPHRARLIGDFLARSVDADAAPSGLPERLSIFACLNISPDVLRCFGAVARSIEVDFYLPTPCREYWGDVVDPRTRLRRGAAPLERVEQPLLASFGRVGREIFEQVFSYDDVQPASEVAIVRVPDRATLLGRIQADILDLERPAAGAPRPPLDAADHSLRVHDCHSPLREVEVLHDRLLAMFARDATLAPRDIVVMTPKIAAYAAAIDAVFGALPAGDARRIAYTIADRTAADAHPLVQMFERWLGLVASRWTLGEILDVLAVPAIMRKAGLDADALARLRGWLESAGVRWGLDAGTRSQFGAGNYAAFSWAEGIERLLLGFASGDDAAIADIAPLPLIEGHAATTLGQACSVLRELEQLAIAQRSARSARAWQSLYQATLRALLPDRAVDGEERRAVDAIEAALATFADAAEAGHCDEALDWQTARACLSEQLAAAVDGQRFLRGGVSFCGMLPLRSLPFRVIAVIGLDDDAYPRREPASGISRLESELRTARRLGDRSVRDDDRYLFLQLLTSARDALHLSYVGRDARTGQPRAPSAVVAELVDEVVRDYIATDAAARGTLVVQHPLQPFARTLFDAGDAELFTFRDEWRAAAAGARSNRIVPFAPTPVASPRTSSATPTPLERVPLDQMLRFWRNPARAFLSSRLRVDLREGEAIVDDADPLAPDGLGTHRLRRALTAARLDGHAEMRSLDEPTRMRQALPVGAVGRDIYRQAADVAAALADEVATVRATMTAAMPFDFATPVDATLIIEGSLADVSAEGLVRWCAGKMHGANWLAPWLDYAALVAARADDHEPVEAITLTAVSFDQTVRVERVAGLAAARAKAILAQMLALMRDGDDRPLPFFAKSSWEYAAIVAGRDRDSSVERALRSARSVFDGNDHLPGESDDAWIALAFRDRHPFDDAPLRAAFERISLAVFGALAALRYRIHA